MCFVCLQLSVALRGSPGGSYTVTESDSDQGGLLKAADLFHTALSPDFELLLFEALFKYNIQDVFKPIQKFSEINWGTNDAVNQTPPSLSLCFKMLHSGAGKEHGGSASLWHRLGRTLLLTRRTNGPARCLGPF